MNDALPTAKQTSCHINDDNNSYTDGVSCEKISQWQKNVSIQLHTTLTSAK